ncbi:TcpQ domain-containing protein [Achromobacter denitrificans]
MVRLFFMAAGLSCLGACSWSDKGAAGPAWQAARPAASGFHFDWRLSGDPAVAPMQVFDDGKETWLQFAPGQALPAIFGIGGDGERALPYFRRDPYVVLTGGWDNLSFRGGRLAARAQRMQSVAGAGAERGPAAPQAVAQRIGPEPAIASAPAAVAPLAAVAQPLDSGLAPAAAPDGAAPPSPDSPGASAAPYRAAPPDATLRAVLARWAGMAGWTFQPQHWAVDVDIPLSATAEFPGDFKSAVRELLGATELAEKPLQPCFYGNKVLRVVPLAQSCTRMSAPGGEA